MRTKKELELLIAKKNYEIEKLSIEMNYYEEVEGRKIWFNAE